MDDVNKAAVGKRIQRARERVGLRFANELATVLGTSKHNVYRWESGKNLPSPEWLHKIAQACRVSQSWLLTGKEESSLPEGLREFFGTDSGRAMPRPAREWLMSIPEPDPDYPADVEWWRLMFRAWQLRLDLQSAIKAATYSRHPETFDGE